MISLSVCHLRLPAKLAIIFLVWISTNKHATQAQLDKFVAEDDLTKTESLTSPTTQTISKISKQPQTAAVGSSSELAPCTDETSKCVKWAKAGECYMNPAYMLEHCHKSCGACTDGDVRKYLSAERQLKIALLKSYDRAVRPVVNSTGRIAVTLAVTLIQVSHVDFERETLVIRARFDLNWIDVNLRWRASSYDNIKTITLPANKIWLPELTTVNSIAPEPSLPTSGGASWSLGSLFAAFTHQQTPAIIRQNGTIDWHPIIMLDVPCSLGRPIRGRYPRDTYACSFDVAPWQTIEAPVELKAQRTSLIAEENNDYKFIDNAQWKVTDTHVADNDLEGAIRIVIELKRVDSSYVLRVIMPAIILNSLIFTVFVLPIASFGLRIFMSTVAIMCATSMLIVFETAAVSVVHSSQVQTVTLFNLLCILQAVLVIIVIVATTYLIVKNPLVSTQSRSVRLMFLAGRHQHWLRRLLALPSTWYTNLTEEDNNAVNNNLTTAVVGPPPHTDESTNLANGHTQQRYYVHDTNKLRASSIQSLNSHGPFANLASLNFSPRTAGSDTTSNIRDSMTTITLVDANSTTGDIPLHAFFGNDITSLLSYSPSRYNNNLQHHQERRARRSNSSAARSNTAMSVSVSSRDNSHERAATAFAMSSGNLIKGARYASTATLPTAATVHAEEVGARSYGQLQQQHQEASISESLAVIVAIAAQRLVLAVLAVVYCVECFWLMMFY